MSKSFKPDGPTDLDAGALDENGGEAQAKEGEGSSSADDFLRQVAHAPPVMPRAPERDRIGETLGHFQLTDLLGRGGMGIVYAAVDLTLHRKVALKLLPAQAIGSEERWRLLREAQAAAAVNHPNIAAVHEVGEVNGEVFIAMELVEGSDMRAWLTARTRSTREILDVFAMAGRGLAAAHRIGIIHRDFKPDNVLIDATGRARVADFGLAAGFKPSSEELSTAAAFPGSGLTHSGRVAGTAGYIAPEHLAGGTADTRADQFAFCVALFEAFEGHRPYEKPELDAFARGAAARLPRPRTRKTPIWLRGLVARGLAADPDLRFSHMEALLTKLDRARMLPRRAVLSLVIATIASVAVFLVIHARAEDARVAKQQRAMALSRELTAVAQANISVNASLSLALLKQASQLSETTELFSVLAQWANANYLPVAILSGHSGRVSSAAFSPDGSRVVTASLYDTAARLWDASSGKPLATLSGHSGEVSSAAFSPDGSRVVTASDDNTARIWDASSGKPLATLLGHSSPVFSAAFSPDGSKVVTASYYDNTARIWDASSGKPLATLLGRVRGAAFSPDSSRVVTASDDNTARIWDASSGKPLATLSGYSGPVSSAAFSPDGSRVVTTSGDSTARIWDASSGKPLATLSGHSGGVLRAAFSPDGSRVVTASDGPARIWDASSGELLATLFGHSGGVSSAAFSPDGSRVVTASDDKTARIWDASSGKPLATLSGHSSSVLRAAFSPDGSRVVTAGDKTARIWDASSGKPLVTLFGHSGGVSSAAFSPDGSRVVTASEDRTALVWQDLRCAPRSKQLQVLDSGRELFPEERRTYLHE